MSFVPPYGRLGQFGEGSLGCFMVYFGRHGRQFSKSSLAFAPALVDDRNFIVVKGLLTPSIRNTSKRLFVKVSGVVGVEISCAANGVPSLDPTILSQNSLLLGLGMDVTP